MISLEYPDNGLVGINNVQTWWGNTIFTRTADWNALPLKTVPPGKFFGFVMSFRIAV